MRSRCLLQVAFVLSSLVLIKAQDVSGPALSCVRSSPADGHTRVSFLREDGARARALFFTLWSPQSRLLICEVISEPRVTERYRELCARSETWGQEITPKFRLDAVLNPAGPCAQISQSAPKFSGRRSGDGTEGRTRRKRAWILPGTLWCGSGSRAGGYEQLGMFESADRCCREHDHCLHIIPAFTVNYGVFNSNLFTVSHCECDQRKTPAANKLASPFDMSSFCLGELRHSNKIRMQALMFKLLELLTPFPLETLLLWFRECLLGVNDSISSMVGYSFFNILQVPCFELKKQRRCTEMYWWGMCKVTKVAPYAVFKNPLPYNTSAVTSENAGSDNSKSSSKEVQFVSEGPTISTRRKPSKTKHRCSFRDLPRGDTFHRRKMKRKGCKQRQEPSAIAPSQTPPTLKILTTAPMMKIDHFNAPKSSSALSNARRAERNKSIQKSLSAYPTQRSHVTRNLSQRFSPTLPSTFPLTQKQKFGLQPTTGFESVLKRTNKNNNVQKLNRCCRSRKPVMGDTFQPRCKNCYEQETASHKKRVTLAKTTVRDFTTKHTTLENLPLKKKAETSKRHSLASLLVAETTAAAVTTKPPKKGTRRQKSKQRKQMASYLMRGRTNQEPTGSNVTQSTHAGTSLQWEDSPRNEADHQLPCESLKLLDECRFKIPPLEKKYNLQNWESKNMYHCDCTNRLAAEMESLKLTSVVASLLVDFVSQQCFTLPKEKKCLHKKSCSGGFTEASDLHQALKKLKKKDTGGVQNSNSARKRGIPVRLSKRCLRLKREDDFMALSR